MQPQMECSGYPHSCQPTANLMVPVTAFFDSINLTERLTELRKTCYLHYSAYYKEYNSGTVKWNVCEGQGMGVEGGAEFPCPTWV